MKFLATLVFWVLLLVGMIWLIAEGTRVAVAHSWYPISCCSGVDCFPVPQEGVKVTDHGYEVDFRGRHYVIPFWEANTTPHVEAGESGYHICVKTYATTDHAIGDLIEAIQPSPEQNRSNTCFWAPDPGS